jgi:hypothetical protein
VIRGTAEKKESFPDGHLQDFIDILPCSELQNTGFKSHALAFLAD